jgi:molecular chaperone DnaJ
VSRDDTRGANIREDVQIEFIDSLKGTEIELDMNKRVICHTCRGTRAAPDSKPRKCFECGGRGSIIGNYGIKKRCPKCQGGGCTPK